MVRKAVNIGEEEYIANEVKKYLCLYCKNCSAFKDKRAKAEAWAKIEEKLGLEEGSAETRFINLRQRYRKKKNAVRKAKPFGTPKSKNLQVAEANLHHYDFLKWLDPYIAGPSSVSNLVDDNNETTWIDNDEVIIVRPNDQLDDSEEFEDSDDEQRKNMVNAKKQTIVKIEWEEEEKEEEREKEKEIEENKDEERELVQVITDPKKMNNTPKRQLENVLDGASSFKKLNVTCDDVLETINKRRFGEREKRMEKIVVNEEGNEADESDVFGKMVAFELRSLPKRKQIKLKHDINNAIFKYQCEVEEEENQELLRKEQQLCCKQQQQLDTS